MLKYCFLFFLFSISNLYAQNLPKDVVLCMNQDGVDLYPAYQASVKKSFVDSIISAGPFIIFCISFEKPNSDKTYRLESPKSDQSWTCHNHRGLHRPMKILNVRCNNELVSENLLDESLDIPLEQDNSLLSSFSKISCELQFLRVDFANGSATLSQSFKEQKTTAEARNTIEFKNIRIRKDHFTRPLNEHLIKKFISDYTWDTKELFEHVIVKMNEVVVDNSTFKGVASNPKKYRAHDLTYSVDRKGHNQIYLDKITQDNNQTIFSIRTYNHSTSSVTLYNTKPNKYYLQHKNKRTEMKTIKNVCLNGKLITEEIKDGDVLNIKTKQFVTIITFDVHFDKVPERLLPFNLIEGKRIKKTIPFDIFNIQG